jgi:hypothetical protein
MLRKRSFHRPESVEQRFRLLQKMGKLSAHFSFVIVYSCHTDNHEKCPAVTEYKTYHRTSATVEEKNSISLNIYGMADAAKTRRQNIIYVGERD